MRLTGVGLTSAQVQVSAWSDFPVEVVSYCLALTGWGMSQENCPRFKDTGKQISESMPGSQWM